jgi:hypothetical protein
LKASRTGTAAQIPHVFHRTGTVGANFANSYDRLHGLHTVILASEIAFANRLTHKFRDTGFVLPRTGVQRIPKVIVKIELRAPHDV